MGNNMRYFWMVMLTAFTLSSFESLAKGPATPHTIAIMPMGYQGGFSEDKARILDELILAEITKYPQHQFITTRDIEGILGFEVLRQAFNCEADSCIAEIGGALGAAEVVTGTASKLGSTVIITLTRIDTNKVAVLGRGSSTTEISKEDDLIAGVRNAFKAMMKGKFTAKPRVAKKKPKPTPAKPIPIIKPTVEFNKKKNVDGRNWEPGAITWTFWSAGIVSAAGGFVMWSRAQKQETDSFQTDVPGSQRAAYDASKSVLIANTLFAGAGGLVAVGIMNWLLFDLTPEDTQVAVDVGPSGSMSLSLKKAW
jgi:hypothetical protein